MGYVPYRRATLLRDFGTGPHLFVVLNDPCKDKMCLCVMVSSIKKGRSHDSACELKDGDHEFIKHPSYLVYRLAECERASHVSKMVDAGSWTIKPDMSEATFAKVAAGLLASDNTTPRILAYAKSVSIGGTAAASVSAPAKQ